jgi:hypothetical protein
LRVIGIDSADRATESGKDYVSALKSISSGFDFVGIGAAKLTSKGSEFEAAIRRMGNHQKQARILLCDPRSKGIELLERNAGVNAGRYRTNVKQSFSLLQHLVQQVPEAIEVRLYNVDEKYQLPPFRMMFINDGLVLISQVVVGAPKEGRALPQLHLKSKTVGEQLPNFYSAYHTLFEQLWSNSKPATQDDFDDIARGRTMSVGGSANA